MSGAATPKPRRLRALGAARRLPEVAVAHDLAAPGAEFLNFLVKLWSRQRRSGRGHNRRRKRRKRRSRCRRRRRRRRGAVRLRLLPGAFACNPAAGGRRRPPPVTSRPLPPFAAPHPRRPGRAPSPAAPIGRAARASDADVPGANGRAAREPVSDRRSGSAALLRSRRSLCLWPEALRPVLPWSQGPCREGGRRERQRAEGSWRRDPEG